MSQTQRTLAALLALLPDNTSGEVTPEDSRDIVASLQNAHGEITLVALENDSVTPGTYEKAGIDGGTSALTSSPAAKDFTNTAVNRLTYGGTSKRLVRVSFTGTVLPQVAISTISFRFYKNGLAVTASTLALVCTADMLSLSLQAIVEMVSTDYVELWVTSTDAAGCVISGVMQAFGFAIVS